MERGGGAQKKKVPQHAHLVHRRCGCHGSLQKRAFSQD
jgi:hypothetical protein